MQPNSGTYDIFLFLFLFSLAMLAGFGIVTIFISVTKKLKKENNTTEIDPIGQEKLISTEDINSAEDSQQPT